MSLIESLAALNLSGDSTGEVAGSGFERDGHSGSLNHHPETIIRNHLKGVVSEEVRRKSMQKKQNKGSLEGLHDRVRLYCDDGQEMLEVVLPSRPELHYREAILANLLKRTSTISQEELSEPRLRNELIPWMARVHGRSKFKFQTLHTAVRLVDLYLSMRTPSAQLYQVLGASALCMAVKLEQTMTGFALVDWMLKLQPHSLSTLKDMENEILLCLDFNLTAPSSHTFFEIAVTYFNLTRRAYYLAVYLLELSLLDYKYLRFGGNLIAIAAVYLSLRMVDPGHWNEVVISAFSLKLQDVREVAKELLKTLLANLIDDGSYTHRKFSKGRYCRLGRMQI